MANAFDKAIDKKKYTTASATQSAMNELRSSVGLTGKSGSAISALQQLKAGQRTTNEFEQVYRRNSAGENYKKIQSEFNDWQSSVKKYAEDYTKNIAKTNGYVSNAKKLKEDSDSKYNELNRKKEKILSMLNGYEDIYGAEFVNNIVKNTSTTMDSAKTIQDAYTNASNLYGGFNSKEDFDKAVSIYSNASQFEKDVLTSTDYTKLYDDALKKRKEYDKDPNKFLNQSDRFDMNADTRIGDSTGKTAFMKSQYQSGKEIPQYKKKLESQGIYDNNQLEQLKQLAIQSSTRKEAEARIEELDKRIESAKNGNNDYNINLLEYEKTLWDKKVNLDRQKEYSATEQELAKNALNHREEWVNYDSLDTVGQFGDVLTRDPVGMLFSPTSNMLFDRERLAIYNWIKENEGEEKAEKYLDVARYNADNEMRDEASKKLAEFQEKNGEASNIPLALLSSASNIFAAPLASIEDTYNKFKYEDFNTSGLANTVVKLGRTANELVQENALKDIIPEENRNVFQFLYGVGASTVESAVSSALFKPVSTILMGQAAGAQKAQEMYEQGYDSDKIALTSVAVGVAEALFEKLSLDNWVKLKSSSSFKNKVVNVLKQAGVEASEEGFTDIANFVTDAIINGYDSEYNNAVRQYIESGMTEGNAKKKAFLDFVGNTAQDMAAGFLSGGIHAGVVPSMYNYRNGTSLSASAVESLVEYGKNSENEDAKRLASAIEDRLSKGKSAGNTNVSELLSLYRESSAEENRKTAMNYMTENGIGTVEAEQISTDMAKAIANDTKFDYDGIENNKVLQNAYRMLNGYGDTSIAQTNEINNRNLETQFVSTPQTASNRQNLFKSAAQQFISEVVGDSSPTEAKSILSVSADGNTTLKSNGKPVTFERVQNVDGKNTTVVVKNSIGAEETVKATDVMFGDTNTAIIVDTAISLGMNSLATNEFVNGFKGDNVGAYIQEFAQSYNAGKLDVNPVLRLGTLTEQQQNTARELGRIATMSKGFEYDSKGRIKATVENAEEFARRCGTNLVVKEKEFFPKNKEGNRANGYFDEKSNTIYLNKDAVDPLGYVVKHEFVHYLKANSKMFGDLSSEILKSKVFYTWLNSKGFRSMADMEKSLAQNEYKDVYDSANQEEKLKEEIFATFCGDVLFGGKDSFSSELLGTMDDETRSKFIRGVKSFLQWLKDKFVKGSNEYKEIQRIEKTFLKVAKDAEKFAKAQTLADKPMSPSDEVMFSFGRDSELMDKAEKKRATLEKSGKKFGTRVTSIETPSGEDAWYMEITDDMRKSVMNDKQPLYSFPNSNENLINETFYSKMVNVLSEMKQEKVSASGVIPYLTSRGVKQDEIHWSGIEDFVKGKKSLTKTELVDFAKDNIINIGESVLENNYDSNDYVSYMNAKDETRERAFEIISERDDGADYDAIYVEYDADEGFTAFYDGEIVYQYNPEENNTRWSEYKTSGGYGYKELVFVLPNSEYTNDAMQTHWGYDAKGVIAHARVQDIDDSYSHYLFVEEIQSDWHNAGAAKGYMSKSETNIVNAIEQREKELEKREEELAEEIYDLLRSDDAEELVGAYQRKFDLDTKNSAVANLATATRTRFDEFSRIFPESVRSGTAFAKYEGLISERSNVIDEIDSIFDAQQGVNLVPDAPFKTNYTDFVLKRLLFMASSEGYDGIGWTSAQMQSYRWSDQYAEGYRIEYDQEIPKFMNKFGKKFGTRVTSIETPSGEDAWYMEITDDMRKSVMNDKQPLYSFPSDGTLDPKQIANLKQGDFSDTNLKPREGKNNGDAESNFKESLQGSSIFDDRLKELTRGNTFIESYKTQANAATMKRAQEMLDNGGAKFINEWNAKKAKDASAEDVAVGFILMYRYQQVQDYEQAVAAAEHTREIGTNAGRVVQMFSILDRFDPNMMQLYAQKALDKAFEEYKKFKSNEWLKKNKDNFNLTPEDIDFIRNQTILASHLPEGREKAIRIAEIATFIQNKIPPARGQALKAIQRISMLLNPKTNIRNVLGNATMIPAFISSDIFGTAIDSLVANKTGVRTQGFNWKLKGIPQAVAKGARESIDDWKRGINTKEELDRFDIGEGKSFNENSRISALSKAAKAMNEVDAFTGFLLDFGDRPFFEAWYANSLQKQMKANGVSLPTEAMVKIAQEEALQRTWQDTNAYTKFVSQFKKTLNTIRFRGYGLGDVLIKFTKTPANLTKALVDFSPIGVVKAVSVDADKFVRAFKRGEDTTLLQKKFVDSLSKGLSGSMVYVLSAILYSLGLLKGKRDDDKDVANFEQYVQGIPAYSVKIGNSWWSYDWSQPLGGILGTVSDFMKGKDEGKPIGETILDALAVSGDMILDQSFLKSIQELFSRIDSEGLKGVFDTIVADPASNVPTFFGQIANLFDPYARNQYSANSVEYTWNKIKAKIPALRNTLPKTKDVLGRDVPNSQHNAINSFFNPMNTTMNTSTPVTDEVYRLYKSVGDKQVIPEKAGRYVTVKNIKNYLSSEQQSEYQAVYGATANDVLTLLISDYRYRNLSDEQKASAVKKVYEYARTVARSSVVYDFDVANAVNENSLTEDSYNRMSDDGKRNLTAGYFFKSKKKYLDKTPREIANLILD